MDDNDRAVQAYYALDLERDRLAAGLGRFEFERTINVIQRLLPTSPAVVADIGGGPGCYTDWLVERGHAVVHRDVVPHHVDQLRQRHGDRVDTGVADARRLDLPDDSVDAMLSLGPLYHLPDAGDRADMLAEAARCVRPGGVVWIACITRWAARVHGVLATRAHAQFPEMLDLLGPLEANGAMPALFEGSFNGYTHTPEELRAEVDASPLELVDLVAVESVATVMSDIDERMADDEERRLLHRMIRDIEAVPDLLGVSPHLIAIARA